MAQDTASQLIPLHAGWFFRARPSTREPDPPWYAASVPGSVQFDLLRHGVIPDPYIGLNELQVQWVGETDWHYRTVITAEPATLRFPHLDLCFAGLDTVCEVRLNGAVLFQSDNMFVPHRVDVKPLLRAGENTLELLFTSPLTAGRLRETERGSRPVWNGDPSRVYLRKAQYHYGWDWGPVVLTVGPWKSIELHAYHARLIDVAAPVTLAADSGSAQIHVQAALAGDLDGAVQATLCAPDGATVAQAVMPAHDPAGALDFQHPLLWWPHGYGEQPLYSLHVTLVRRGEVLDERTLRLGMRHLELRQEPVAGEDGRSFTFVVNGVPIFAGGANWIPEDLLLNRVTPAQERARIEQAVAANMVMLRVWAGGIYESTSFYDTCDELGMLVWQDFLFSCGMYPAHPAFLESVQQEAEAAVARLRHHASLALWCGNNEDYQIAESVGAGDFSAQDHLETSTFPAREIYERLLPDVCARLDPQRPYWPGSPYTPGGGATTQPTAGDRHTWDIWHGVMAPYTDYANYEGRFVSEFGLQAPPAASTIASFTKPADRHAHSRVMEHHNKAPDGSRRLAAYLSDTLNPPADFGAWVYGTRLVQAEAMQAACRAYRRRWGQEGQRAVSGALVWQLNDCWPVTSWSLIDSCGLPKPAWYAVGREFQPLAIGISREGGTLATWLCSAARQDQPLELEFTSCGLDGMQLHQEKQTVAAASNATTPVTWRVPAVPDDAAVFIRGFQNGVEVARSALWPHPLKHHDLPDPGLRVSWQGDQLDVVARGPAKAVWIEASGVPSDNHLDLMPGEHVTVTLAGAAAVEVRAVGSPVVHVANTHTG